MDTMDLPDSLQQAIEVAQSGDKSAASRLLAQYVTQDPRNDLAWLWLAACLDEPNQQRYCLSKATALNPNNPDTISGLMDLVNPPWARRQDSQPIELPPAPAFTPESAWTPEPEPAAKPIWALEPEPEPEIQSPWLTGTESEPEQAPTWASLQESAPTWSPELEPEAEPAPIPESRYAQDLFATEPDQPAAEEPGYAEDRYATPTTQVPVYEPEPAAPQPEAVEPVRPAQANRFTRTQIGILLFLVVGILVILAVLGYFVLFVNPEALPMLIRSIFNRGG